MKDILLGKLIDFIISNGESIIKKFRDSNSWKELFIETGSIITNSRDFEETTKTQLIEIFSKNNMKKLSKELENTKIYDLKKELYNSVYNIFISHDYNLEEAIIYTNNFLNIFLDKLEQENPEKDLILYIASWKDELQSSIIFIKKELEEIKTLMKNLDKSKFFTLNEIDYMLRKSTQTPLISLDFFELDDDKFKQDFSENLRTKNILYIEGNSREETLLRVLNEINNIKKENSIDFDNTFIFKTQKDWDNYKSLDDTKKNILIPFFYSDQILPKENNINIFIYNENDACNRLDKLSLRRRTKGNIVEALAKTGRTHEVANELFKKTNGLYIPMKNKLFIGQNNQIPAWCNINPKIAVTILLCGQWNDTAGDKLIIEDLSELKYEDFINEIKPYMFGENPLIIKINNTYKIADIEYTWEVFDKYIDKPIWTKFLDTLFVILSDKEKLFEIEFEKHWYLSAREEYQSEWSRSLKHGMLQSLIMRAIYRNHDEYQNSINLTINEILQSINTKEKWAYISQYIKEICEAAPDIFLNRLEYEIDNPTGMIELFKTNFDGMLSSSNYYINILWALEQLLLQKQYVYRAINLLWKLNEKAVEYKMNNSPKSTLEDIFCAWINTSVISVDDKVDLITNAIKKYDNSWDIVYSLLPDKKLTIFGSFSSPKYRPTDEIPILYQHEVSNTFMEYFKICVDNINGKIERWIKIINQLNIFPKQTIKDTLDKLYSDMTGKEDSENFLITNTLREIIYKHRYFKYSNWAMDEDKVVLFEKILNNIQFNDEIYNYLYFFTSKYRMNILHPIPYREEKELGDYKNGNEKLITELLIDKFKQYKKNNLSLDKLIILTQENQDSDLRTLGLYIAKYFDNTKYNTKTLDIICKNDKDSSILYWYINEIYQSNNYDRKLLIKIINNIRDSTTPQNLVDILLLEKIEDYKIALINKEEDYIKKLYWNKYNRNFHGSTETIYIWALNECLKYKGNLNTYIELLYDAMDIIDLEKLYNYSLKLKDISNHNFENLASYYLTEILKKLQNKYINSKEKCSNIADLEYYFMVVLDWHQMKCLEKTIKKNPDLYAKIIIKICNNDEKEQAEINILRDFLYKLQFCPGDFDNKIDEIILNSWVEEFKQLLANNNQKRLFTHFLGKLFPFSPPGEDGIIPCEAIRQIIEQYHDEELLSSYIITQENKRGFYTPDAGKSEYEMAQNYKEIANKLRIKYPHTATIFDKLSQDYNLESKGQREKAENGYF